MFFVNSKGETSEEIKFMPVVSYPPTARDIGQSDSHVLKLPIGTGAAVQCSQSHLCPRLDKPPTPGTLLQPRPSLNSLMFIDVFPVLGNSI